MRAKSVNRESIRSADARRAKLLLINERAKGKVGVRLPFVKETEA